MEMGIKGIDLTKYGSVKKVTRQGVKFLGDKIVGLIKGNENASR